MRRKDREIFGQEIEEILRKGAYGVLSMTDEKGAPYAVPISYAFQDGLIHLHCAANAGEKLRCLAACDRVCFVVVGDTEVQPEEYSTRYESVVVKGQMIASQTPQRSLLALVEKYSPQYIDQAPDYLERYRHQTGVYTILPEEITGKAKR